MQYLRKLDDAAEALAAPVRAERKAARTAWLATAAASRAAHTAAAPEQTPLVAAAEQAAPAAATAQAPPAAAPERQPLAAAPERTAPAAAPPAEQAPPTAAAGRPSLPPSHRQCQSPPVQSCRQHSHPKRNAPRCLPQFPILFTGALEGQWAMTTLPQPP